MITKFVAFLLLTFTTAHQSQLIPWNASRKLTWDDFRAKPDSTSSNAALTSSTINIEFGFDEKGLEYSINCSFDKTKSWVRIKNNDVLLHEQGHFDMAEVHARKLYQAMKAYRFKAATVSSDVNKIYERIMKAHHEAQHLYDQETDYSRNKVKQQEWLKKIAGDLKVLEPFAGYSKPLGKG